MKIKKRVKDTEGELLTKEEFYHKWFKEEKNKVLYKCVLCGADVYKEKHNLRGTKCLSCKFPKKDGHLKGMANCQYCTIEIERPLSLIRSGGKFTCTRCRQNEMNARSLLRYHKNKEKINKLKREKRKKLSTGTSSVLAENELQCHYRVGFIIR